MDTKERKCRSAYQMADLSYQFCQLSREMDKRQVDYGTGELFTAAEVHMLTRIEENPGSTVTQIANQTFRTKSAVSQIVSTLEKRGLLRRERDTVNPKQTLLYVTPKGLTLSKLHKAYDDRYLNAQDLIALFGIDSVNKFFDIMEYLIQVQAENLQQLRSNEKPYK